MHFLYALGVSQTVSMVLTHMRKPITLVLVRVHLVIC